TSSSISWNTQPLSAPEVSVYSLTLRVKCSFLATAYPASLPPDPKLEGHIRLIADVDAVEIGAAGNVFPFEEMVIEDVAAGQIDRRFGTDRILHTGGQS